MFIYEFELYTVPDSPTPLKSTANYNCSLIFLFFLHLFSQKCLFAKNTKFFHRVFVVVCTSPCYCIFLPTCVYERMSECVCMGVVCSKKKNLSSYSPRPQVDGKMHCKLQCNVANIVEQKNIYSNCKSGHG